MTTTAPPRSTATIERELALVERDLGPLRAELTALPARREEAERRGDASTVVRLTARERDLGAAIAQREQRYAALQNELNELRHREATEHTRADLDRQRAAYEARIAGIGPALGEFVRSQLRGMGEDVERIAQLEGQLGGRDPVGVAAELLAAPREIMRTACRWLPAWIGTPRTRAPERLGILDGGRIYETLHRAFFDRYSRGGDERPT